MRILLTGYKGFIGQNTFTKLEECGYEVVGYDWDENRFPSLDGINTVIHMGAISSTLEHNVEKILKQNYDFSVKLIDKCVAKNIPLHFSSSGSVYGRGVEFKETSPVSPITPYAWSKLTIERYCKKYSDASIKILRYFNVYSLSGEAESHKINQWSPYYKFRKQAEKTGEIELYVHPTHGTAFRDFIEVGEVVNYHLKFLKLDISGVFNIGTGKVKSFQQVAQEVASQCNAKVVEKPLPEDMVSSTQWFTCADMTKTNSTLEQIQQKQH